MTISRGCANIVFAILYLTSVDVRASKRCRQFAGHVPFALLQRASCPLLRIADLNQFTSWVQSQP